MSPVRDDGLITCHACGRAAVDHTREEQRKCFLTIPHLIDKALSMNQLLCDEDGPSHEHQHSADLMADDGGLYCVVHQPTHTGVVVPREAMLMYTVFDHPKDFPTGWVIRRFIGTRPTAEAYTVDTEEKLEGIRREFESCGLMYVARQPGDDPVVQEVWM